jgi:hypothetical protein
MVGIFDSSTCIGCGCTEACGCSGGCWWVREDPAKQIGVCSECEILVSSWDAGNRRPYGEFWKWRRAVVTTAKRKLGRIKADVITEDELAMRQAFDRGVTPGRFVEEKTSPGPSGARASASAS